MKQIQEKNKIRIYGAAAGFGLLALPFFYRQGLTYGPTELGGLAIFFCLVQTAASKKELSALGLALGLATILRYSGLCGYFLLDAAILSLQAACIMAAMVLQRYAWKKYPQPLATLVFPIVWQIGVVFFALMRAPMLMRIDAMFADLPALMQCEVVLSPYGLNFLLLWAVSACVYAVVYRKKMPLVAAVSVFSLLLIAGQVIIASAPEPESILKAAYTTGPYIGNFIDYGDTDYENKIASLQRSASDAKKAGASVLIFNEEAFTLQTDEYQDFLDMAAQTAREEELHLLVGMDLEESGLMSSNRLVWIDPEGTILGEYDKYNTIPGLESDYQRGNGEIPVLNLTIDGEPYRIGFAICYDSNFPLYLSQLQGKADLLLLPSWDWDGITDMHYRICLTDAVSRRITLLKPTYDGISVAADPYGRILQMTDTKDTGYETVQLAELPKYSSVYSAAAPAAEMDVDMKRAIVFVELFSILVCVILFYANHFETRQTGKRRSCFDMILMCTIIALLGDMISWWIDGRRQLLWLNYIGTMISIVMSFVISITFLIYIYYYLIERQKVSGKLFEFGISYCLIGAILTFFACLSGSIFTLHEGVFAEGPFYTHYVISNAISLIAVMFILWLNAKNLGIHDTLVTQTYILIPFIEIVVNGIFPDFSMVYPAATLSLLIQFILLQSDHEGELIESRQTIYQMATHDALTGLLNRQAFFDFIRGLGSEGSMGVLFCDANALKYSNDKFGHEAGDRLLCRISDQLRHHFRSKEIFRLSGDEFVVLLPDMSLELLRERLALLRAGLADGDFPAASCGMSYGSKQDVYSLIEDAEKSMYAEKKQFYEDFPHLHR